MPRAGFEPAIPATKRPQTYALDRAAFIFIDLINLITFGDDCKVGISSLDILLQH
jgi:hypothetical protein